MNVLFSECCVYSFVGGGLDEVGNGGESTEDIKYFFYIMVDRYYRDLQALHKFNIALTVSFLLPVALHNIATAKHVAIRWLQYHVT